MENKVKIVNLSNHPSVKWEEKQVNAVKEYATLITALQTTSQIKEIVLTDLPHPQIPSSEDENFVDKLAEEYIQKLQEMSANVVFLAGELSFVSSILRWAFTRKPNVHIITSTTERIVEEKDGVKISKFQFGRIRKLYSPPVNLEEEELTLRDFEEIDFT